MGTKFDLDDEAFQREFLGGVDRLAVEAGDWRDHLPYEAAYGYHTDERIREAFRCHVKRCAYCQELITTLVGSSAATPKF